MKKAASSNYRSDLKRVRGLGAAHEGTHHFWLQRMTALALIPLTVWFMVKLVTFLATAERGMVGQWFADPITSLAMAVFLVAMFLHARLGIQIIIEDYVHHEGKKLALLILNSAFLGVLCIASLFALAQLHFIGIK